MNKFFFPFALAILLVAKPAAAQIDFKKLTPGEILENQLADQGIRFIPYGRAIKGTIESTPDGNVAQFHFCSGCEFFPSGAHAAFTNLQQSITVHLGLPAIEVPLQLQIKFSAFDGSGNLVASTLQDIIAGTGYKHEMTVFAAGPVIASIIIEATNDFASNGIITLTDITLTPTVSSSPDFLLQGAPDIEIVAGGHQINLPISILRLGSSTGDISFSATDLPPGVRLDFLPTPVSNNNLIGLQLIVPANASSANQLITIKGQPLVAAAGPLPRFYTPRIRITQAFTILSNADINISACKPGGPTGTVTLPVTVLRNGKVSGPATLSIEGLPAGIKAVFNPSVLTFPGNATGQTSILTITATGGLDIGDVLVQIHAASKDFTSTFFADLHGQCPRNNKDFTIKGFFYSNHKGLIKPIEGALVEIYREVPYWFDDQVGKTYTAADGSFELGLWANEEDTYYAKLQLNDEKGVYLHDGYNVGSWEANSVNRGNNKNPIIDLGNTVITKDGGVSTTKASIWQGAHIAYQEYFKSSGGTTPPFGNYEIRVWTGNVFVKSPRTYITSTDWPEGYQTNLNDKLLKGTDVFADYTFNFHEFAHAVRSSLDGDFNHYNKDRIDEKTVEIGDHEFCETTNDGFAFSEGWAQFWAQEHRMVNFCPTANGVVFDVEGNVANDLNHLMECFHKSRGDMIKVLGQRREFIHSDADFRKAFQDFFKVDLSTCPPFGAPGTLHSGKIAANILSARSVPLSLMIERMQSNIDQQASVMQQLEKEYKAATDKAASTDAGKEKDTSRLAIILTAPVKIKGQLQLLRLLQTVFRKQLYALKQSSDSITVYNPAYNDSVAVAAADFDSRAKAIAIQNLTDCKMTIMPYASNLAIKNIIAQLDRKIKLLQVKSTHPINVFGLLKVPVSYQDDTAVPHSTRVIQWWLWVVIALILIGIIAGLLYKRKVG